MAVQSLYGVLGVSPAATYEEIRQGYRKKIFQGFQVHPDKAGEGQIDMARRVVLAWETLRDEQKRRSYDIRYNQQLVDAQHCVFDEASLSEFEKVDLDEDKAYVLNCRCGGVFHLNQSDLDAGFNLISCSNCTARVFIKPRDSHYSSGS